MDRLAFIAKAFEHLAWPVIVLLMVPALAIYLRKELRQLLPSIKRVKAGPVEAEFDRSVSQLREKTTSLPEVKSATPALHPEDHVVWQLAAYYPRSAILEAWREVEIAANQALASVEKPEVSHPRRANEVISEVARRQRLSQELSATLNSLYDIRNRVAHEYAFEPSAFSATHYVSAAKQIKSVLDAKTRGD
ncbi:MAG: hypothetical protein WAM17_10300 [Rhodoplanes sp.]